MFRGIFMIVDERMTAYVRSLEREDGGIAAVIGREARADGVPVIKPETAALLKVLLMIRQPVNILEVGTATAYSAIFMSSCLKPGAHITTIENYQKRIQTARSNIKRAGREDCITLLEGDAMDILPGLEPGYDLIFMDAAKGQYINFLPEVRRLLAPSGVLVSDNVLQDGSIVMPRCAVTRRDRTIHSRMREYLWELKHSDDLETSLLTTGDGVAVSVKC